MIYAFNNPMRCKGCKVRCIERGLTGKEGTQHLPYYLCPECGRTIMSPLTLYVYNKARTNMTTYLGFEGNARIHLKEEN